MFLCVCSTGFSCATAATAGVLAGRVMPRLDKETAGWFSVVSDFSARTLAITARTLAQNNEAAISLRILSFILFSEDLRCPRQKPDRKEGLSHGKWPSLMVGLLTLRRLI